MDAEFTTPQASRPFWARASNLLARPFTRNVDLSSDAIVAKAVSAENATDSEVAFRPALDALCASLEQETRFHPIGRISAQGDTVRLLRTQIRVNRLLRERPEILDVPLPRPIFVIGLPRSGTTILHSVLAQDPAHRALRYFEGFDPSVPAAQDAVLKARLARLLRGLESMAPAYRAIHAMEPDSIEECVTVMYHTFTTIQMEFQYECQGYLAFLEKTGFHDAYAFHRKQLQMLQWQRPHADRWVLKDPAHLTGLDCLHENFPDAHFVWIHRDPTRTLSSIASLTAYTRALFSDAYGAHAVGRIVSQGAWPRALERGLALREGLPADRFVDVRYADFMRDPIAAIERIYASVDLAFTPDAREAMQRFLAANPQHREGAHRHSLEQFGLDREEQSARFADYRDRFDLPAEA